MVFKTYFNSYQKILGGCLPGEKRYSEMMSEKWMLEYQGIYIIYSLCNMKSKEDN